MSVKTPAVKSAVPTIADQFTIAAGCVVKNRFFKSAMSEGLAETDGTPTDELVNLYGRWAQGGAGVLVTGNVMIDPAAIGEPKNVIIHDERHLGALKRWAEAGTTNNTQLWVQLNHPGRQSPKGLNRETVAPSAEAFSPALNKMFGKPRELRHDEILTIIKRFATAAGVFKKAGFTGVQIHGAHGYLVSQFLSSITNKRQDQWGGDIQARMRFVLEIYRAVRAEVGDNYPVGIKLNSADFQKGGFTEEECLAVVTALTDAGINAIEISGGTYEAPAMALGGKIKDSTKIREAYFLDFSEKVRRQSADTSVALIVTGGFRSRNGMNEALAGGSLDLIGTGRPMAMDPDFPQKVLDGVIESIQVKNVTTGIRMVDDIAYMEVAWYERQMKRISKGKKPKIDEAPLLALVKVVLHAATGVFKYRRLRA